MKKETIQEYIVKAACRKIITIASAMNICFERFHV